MEFRASPAALKTALILEAGKILFYVYCFLLSIELMGVAFESFGSGFTHFFSVAVANPLAGLVTGIVVTSIVQSSSMTTSVVVAMVASGTISLHYAIPIIMGANIGTTVTNTIVSFAYLGRKSEFEPSFGASIVHDMFNICAVLVFFPLQVYTGFLEKAALFLTDTFSNAGGFTLISPLQYIITPVCHGIDGLFANKIVMLVAALALLFLALSMIVKNMKGLVMQKVESVLNDYLFRNTFVSLLFGLVLTATIQSSSIATSIIVPLVAAGMLTIEQVFPYTLGANVGTTITAILAALGMGSPIGLAVAFSHLLFNIFGICVFLPLKKIPIGIAKAIAKFSAVSKKNFFIFLSIYVALHTVIILLVFV